MLIRLVITRRKKSSKQPGIDNRLAFIGLFIFFLTGINQLFFPGIMIDFQLPNSIYNMYMDAKIYTYGASVGMVFFVLCYSMVLAYKYEETERLAAEREKENAGLDNLNQIKNSVMAAISHETLTPLAVINTYTELIADELRKAGADSQMAADIDVVTDEIERLASLGSIR
jgi:signal transduction histidine kinase